LWPGRIKPDWFGLALGLGLGLGLLFFVLVGYSRCHVLFGCQRVFVMHVCHFMFVVVSFVFVLGSQVCVLLEFVLVFV
jgi:hypothetical protein